MNNKIKIPIVWGKNKLRGNSEGFLINENSYNFPHAMNDLRNSLKECANLDNGFIPDEKWMANSIISILKMCENYIQGESKGFEANFPNGDNIFFAKEDILNRVGDNW